MTAGRFFATLAQRGVIHVFQECRLPTAHATASHLHLQAIFRHKRERRCMPLSDPAHGTHDCNRSAMAGFAANRTVSFLFLEELILMQAVIP
jgi:hypothetical protein